MWWVYKECMNSVNKPVVSNTLDPQQPVVPAGLPVCSKTWKKAKVLRLAKSMWNRALT